MAVGDILFEWLEGGEMSLGAGAREGPQMMCVAGVRVYLIPPPPPNEALLVDLVRVSSNDEDKIRWSTTEARFP